MDILGQIIALILAAAVTYGAIRQDIKNIHQNISDLRESVNEAHKRIDSIILSEHNK